MIYYRISELLKKTGKSYRTLVNEIGLSYMTIVKLMHAQSQKEYEIGAYSLDKLCTYLKCKPEDLIYYKRT